MPRKCIPILDMQIAGRSDNDRYSHNIHLQLSILILVNSIIVLIWEDLKRGPKEREV